eukprot:6210825-Pleurochrysis_carterae.AAC.1
MMAILRKNQVISLKGGLKGPCKEEGTIRTPRKCSSVLAASAAMMAVLKGKNAKLVELQQGALSVAHNAYNHIPRRLHPSNDINATEHARTHKGASTARMCACACGGRGACASEGRGACAK